MSFMPRAQTGRGVTSDEVQTSGFFTAQLQRNSRKSIVLIRYKTKYVTKQKRHTILVRDGCMLVATTEKADAYLSCLFFGENDQFTLQLRGTSH